MPTIMLTITIFVNLAGSIGELITTIMSVVAGALLNMCQFKNTFASTFLSLFFDSTTGLFRNNGAITNALVDPTKTCCAAGLIFTFFLMTWQLFKNLFADVKKAIPPSKIVFRGGLYSLLIATYKTWTNALMKLIFAPLSDSVAAIDVTTDWSNLIGLAYNQNTDTDFFGTVDNGLNFSSPGFFRILLILVIMFPLGIKFIQLAIELLERFLQIFFLVLFGPLCLACGAAESTENVSESWVKVFINGLIGMFLNMLCVKLCLIATTNFFMSFTTPSASYGFEHITDAVVPFFAVYAFMKISSEMDNIMNKVGLSIVSATNLFEDFRRQRRIFG